MGLLALLAIGFFAFLSTGMMVKTGLTRFVPMAVKVQEHFGLQETKVSSKQVGIGIELDLHYQTSKYRSFDQETLEREMREIAEFAYASIEPANLRAEVRRLHLHREEVTGGGCFEERHKNDFTWIAPPPPPPSAPLPRTPPPPDQPPEDR